MILLEALIYDTAFFFVLLGLVAFIILVGNWLLEKLLS
jgi:hypothetical protein